MEPKRKKKDRIGKKFRRPGKKVMKRKNEERSEEIKTLMIASYREEYSKEALDAIRQIIDHEQPERIIILKLIEEKHFSELVDANVGTEEKKDIIDSVKKEKKKLADHYAKMLIDMVEEFDVQSEVHLRKGDQLAVEIIEEFKNSDVDHLILHGPKKGPLGKVIEGSLSKKVKKKLNTRKITLLD